MTPLKIIGILGAGGLRMDFVAGWLGKLPNFVESDWSIDPITRQSTGTSFNLTDLSQNTLNGFLESHRYCLDADAKLTFATKLHCLYPDYCNLIDNKQLSIYEIVLDTSLKNQASWEFFIKTYGKFEKFNNTWAIDSVINKSEIYNNDRIEMLDSLLRSKTHSTDPSNMYPQLTYSVLFNNGGSKYLCEILGLDVGPAYHQYWDYMLPLAKTPDTITLWDHQFCYNDYFN